MDIISLAKRIRRLRREATTHTEFEELDFLQEIFQVVNYNLESFSPETLIPLNFGICSNSSAKHLAEEYNINVVEGGSGTLYLDLTRSLDETVGC
jgi:hypothetical protein